MGGALAAVLTLGIIPAPVQAEETGGQTDLPAPVLYASFDNGNAEDSSGNGNNGTVIGTPEFVDGVSGKAVHIVNSEDIAGSGADAEATSRSPSGTDQTALLTIIRKVPLSAIRTGQAAATRA